MATGAAILDSPMSAENVETVERWYAAYNDRDLEGALALMHPQVDATSAGMSGVEGSSHIGHAGMRRYFADLWETWENPRVDVDHCLERDGKVVMLGHTSGAGRLSGLEVNFPVASVVEVEDGLIVRYRTYREWDAALEATATVEEREPAADG
jgi:ketosteroid isomerase-like protein